MNVALHETLALSRESVWRRLADPRSYPGFVDGLTRFRHVEGSPMGVGARFRVHMRIGPVELGELIEVVEFDPPADLAWVGVAGIDHRGRWRLRSTPDGGTRVELRFTYHTPGGAGAWLADRVARPIVAGHLRRSLEALRRAEEEPRGPGASSG